MPNLIPAAAEGLPDYPRNPHRIGFFRELLMRWNARRANEPVTQNQDRESFMNQHVDRRALLASSALAIAGTPAAAASVVSLEADKDAGLFSLLHEYEAANAEFAKARDDLEWIVAEWRHLWPLAPEEILGGANAHVFPGGTQRPERDIAGNYMMRERASLTKRLSPKHRREGGQTCFSVDAAAELSEELVRWRKSKPTGRTPKSLASNRAYRGERIAKLEEQLALARQYEAETTRIREASGATKAKARIEQTKAEARAIAGKIMNYPAATFAGASAKAGFFLSYPLAQMIGQPVGDGKGDIFSFGWSLAEDIKRLAADQKGGAA